MTLKSLYNDIVTNPLYEYYSGPVNLFSKDSIAQCRIISDYHFGGYARSDSALLNFCSNFKHSTSVEIEPVYSGKMFYGLLDLITKNYFEPGSRIIALHTGGLQYL